MKFLKMTKSVLLMTEAAMQLLNKAVVAVLGALAIVEISMTSLTYLETYLTISWEADKGVDQTLPR